MINSFGGAKWQCNHVAMWAICTFHIHDYKSSKMPELSDTSTTFRYRSAYERRRHDRIDTMMTLLISALPVWERMLTVKETWGVT
jgi:hypothetical protein